MEGSEGSTQELPAVACASAVPRLCHCARACKQQSSSRVWGCPQGVEMGLVNTLSLGWFSEEPGGKKRQVECEILDLSLVGSSSCCP